MESFGPQLKRERERRGIALHQVAAITKISTRFLRAIEEERLDDLPGGIFNKGFIRAYSRVLGLDEEEMVAIYLSRSSEAQPLTEANALTPVAAQTTQVAREAKVSRAFLATIALVLLLGLAWRGFRSNRKSSQFQFSQFVKSASSANPSSSRNNDHPNNDHPSNVMPQNLESPSKSNVAADLSRLNPQPVTTPFAVRIKAREECWASIESDGKAVEELDIEPGEEKSFQASDRLTIKIGNAGGIELTFNGNRLPRLGEEEEVKTLTFNSKGLQSTTKQ